MNKEGTHNIKRKKGFEILEKIDLFFIFAMSAFDL